jgi:hypothetical protein
VEERTDGVVGERDNLWTSVAVMALIGGVMTALLYTKRGRQSLARVEEALDDFSRSLQQLRGTVQKAESVAVQGIDVASEGIHAVSSLMGKVEQRRQGFSATH